MKISEIKYQVIARHLSTNKVVKRGIDWDQKEDALQELREWAAIDASSYVGTIDSIDDIQACADGESDSYDIDSVRTYVEEIEVEIECDAEKE